MSDDNFAIGWFSGVAFGVVWGVIVTCGLIYGW